MEIEKRTEGSTLLVRLDGRLDTMTSPRLEASLKEMSNDIDHIVFDFEKLDYISSAGLRVLLAAYKVIKAKKGDIKIIQVNDEVYNVFEITGFSDFFEIEQQETMVH